MRSASCLLLTLLSFSLGCNGSTTATLANSPWKSVGKQKVLTSIVPIYCLTAQVAGDDAEVLCLMTAHGPHDFQPTSEDNKIVSETDLFFIVGLNLEEAFVKEMV